MTQKAMSDLADELGRLERAAVFPGWRRSVVIARELLAIVHLQQLQIDALNPTPVEPPNIGPIFDRT